jgi:hypothetical protein
LARSLTPRFRLIEFSPFDLLCYFRLVAFMLAWKALSTDYRAIPALAQGPDLYPYDWAICRQLTEVYRPLLLDEVWKIVALQITAAAFLLAACVRPRRWSLIAGMVPLLLIDWVAYRYREHLWATQVPLSALAVFALWPVRWDRTLVGGRTPTPEANALGRTLAVYFSWGYFFCGLSKLIHDRYWWKTFHNELFYASRNMSKGPLPDWLDPISARLADLYTEYPLFSEGSCLAAVVLELIWFVVLFSKWGRRTIPYLMFATHVGFLITAGFTFTTFVLSALGIVIPWRLIGGRPQEPRPPASSPRWLRAVAIAGLLGATVAAVLPVYFGRRSFYPFPSFNVFGWSQKVVAGPRTWYYLGYVDPATGEMRRLPLNHGGFMDQEQWFVSYRFQNYYSPDSTPEQRQAVLPYIEQYVRALRPHRSNRFLLGMLAMPDNVLTRADPVDINAIGELYVLRYDYHYAERGLTPIVTNLGPVPRRP